MYDLLGLTFHNLPLFKGPGVDPGHLGVTLAPDPDPVHIHPPRDAVVPNPAARPLRKSPSAAVRCFLCVTVV